MNFDIKDVKSWATRHDVKIGDEGYFFYNIDKLRNFENEFKPVKSKLSAIRDDYAPCFQIDNGLDGYNVFPFFLPLDAVKKDKPKEKKYRPFKSMRELTEIVYSEDWEYDDLSVGDSLWIRRKGDEHIYQNLLIISLGYNENDVISMNGKSMQDWFNNYEIEINDEWKPFGAVEDCTGE